MTSNTYLPSKLVSEEEEAYFQKEFEGGPKFVKRPPPAQDNGEYHGYWSPGREDEQLRLTGSHFALKELYGGNIQAEIFEHISFESGIDCLHIYCGAGAFITDMAVEYPKSKFIGVDTAIAENIMLKLPNVTLSPGNIVEGLDFPDSSFDFIQMRVAGTILRTVEWPNALKEVYRLLRPGGCVSFFEFEPRESGNEDCKRVFRGVTKLMDNLKQDALSGQHLKDRLIESGFEHLKTETTLIDCGGETGRAKRWIWMWSELLAIMGPFLAPLLDVQSENWSNFILEHAKDMEQSHGHITAIRVAARKPLN